MAGVADTIKARLTERFRPQELTVLDESHQHAGHSGWREGGETHFRITIVANAFAGKSRLERHQLIHEALAEELAGPIHALAIRADAPAS